MVEIRKEDSIVRSLLALLILSGFASGLNYGTDFFTINISQFLSIILFVSLTVHTYFNKRRVLVLSGDLTSWFIYLYFVSNLFSSIFFSSSKLQSLKGCAVIFSYIIVYISIRWALNLITNKETMVWKMVHYNSWIALFGIFCMMFSFLTGRENIGTSFGQLAQSGLSELKSNIPSIRSLAIEPNLFAIAAGAVMCINLANYLYWKRSLNQFVLIVIMSIAILFAYTRSVYISLAIALITMLVLSGRIRLLISFINYSIILGLVITVIMISLPDDSEIKAVLTSRVTSLFEFKKGSGLGRVYGYQIGMEGFMHNPIFGQGTLTAQTSFFNAHLGITQDLLGSPGWLNGALIQSLHDTGIIGFFIVVGIFLSILTANLKMFRKMPKDGIEKSMLLGFLCGNIIIAISSQLSSTMWISFPFVFWAVNVAFIDWCKRKLFTYGMPF